ncbi:hypothetical protein EQ826_00180 [Ectopseudomonas mendocina]|nr:Cro/CI family transcriptional regulator [Pseudomonas mendocina]TRO21977.1 hypothetical protein EQ828_12885 [Pseudomonas mendocina]TRO29343.1 hypothetical protein EQ826_00180 [Pseudomonas mendocina]
MQEDFGVPLRDFAQGKKQPQIAELLGVTQGAVSQMLHSGRDIRIRDLGNGAYEAIEIRPIGMRRKRQEAA